MLKTWLAAGALGLMVAMSNAQAMPVVDASGDAHVIRAYGAFGPYGHRGPYGGCQPGSGASPGWRQAVLWSVWRSVVSAGLPPWTVSACVLADRLMHESQQG
jgi:hypothetical protein